VTSADLQFSIGRAEVSSLSHFSATCIELQISIGCAEVTWGRHFSATRAKLHFIASRDGKEGLGKEGCWKHRQGNTCVS